MRSKAMIKRIEKEMEMVAKRRDAIDDLISEASDLKESCERALDALQEARDALSELV